MTEHDRGRPGGAASNVLTKRNAPILPETRAEILALAERSGFSEDAHALRLVAAYADLIRFSPQRSRWLAWNGACWVWQPKSGGVVREYAKAVARETVPVDRHARWLSAAGITGCLAMAQTDELITVDLDLEPHLAIDGATITPEPDLTSRWLQ